MDYHAFHSIIKPIIDNINKRTNRSVGPEAAITRKKGETYFTIKFFDRGAGFTSKENFIKWKGSKLTELQTFTKAWCDSSYMHTKINGKYNQLNLLTEHESMNNIIDEDWLNNNKIGTAFIFNIKLSTDDTDDTDDEYEFK